MKIKAKLAAGFSSLLILLLITDVLVYFFTNKLSNSLNMVEENLLQLDLISRLQLTIEKMLAPPHDYSIHGDPAEKEAFNTRHNLVEKMFASLEKTNFTKEEKNTLTEAKAICSEIKEQALKILHADPSLIGSLLAIRPMLKQVDSLTGDLFEKLDALNLSAYEATIIAMSQSKASTYHTNKVLFYCVPIILVNAVVVSLFILYSITQPIKLLKEGAELITHGRLDHRVDLSSKDELKDLADAFNKMVGNLEKSLVDLEGEKNKLETILLDIGDGVVVGDAKHYLLYMNPIAEKILGRRFEDLQGKEFFGCHKEGDKVMKILERDQLPVTTRISYGNQILYINAASIKNADGKILGYTMLVRDVTAEEKMLKERLGVLERTS